MRENGMKLSLKPVIILLVSGVLMYSLFMGKTSLNQEDKFLVLLYGAIFVSGLYLIVIPFTNRKNAVTANPAMIKRNKAIFLMIIVVLLGVTLAFEIF
jgi:hypothetical protein